MIKLSLNHHLMALWAQTLFYFLMADTALCYIHFTSIRAYSYEGVYIKHTATTYIMVGTMVQLLYSSVLCCCWYSQNRLSSEFSSVSRLTGRARQLEHGRGLDVFACAYSDGKNSIWKQNKMRRRKEEHRAKEEEVEGGGHGAARHALWSIM